MVDVNQQPNHLLLGEAESLYILFKAGYNAPIWLRDEKEAMFIFYDITTISVTYIGLKWGKAHFQRFLEIFKKCSWEPTHDLQS